MKIIYLVRHAKSSWKHGDLTDFERPLNERGRKDAPMMGERILEKNISPELLISSSANRAITTARFIATKIGYPLEDIKVFQRLYDADEEDYLAIIKEVDNAFNSIMLFGHNPELTDLASELSGEYIDNIPTCGIVAIAMKCDRWKNIAPEHGSLLFFEYPKMFK